MSFKQRIDPFEVGGQSMYQIDRKLSIMWSDPSMLEKLTQGLIHIFASEQAAVKSLEGPDPALGALSHQLGYMGLQ
jgi:hypothetical protein